MDFDIHKTLPGLVKLCVEELLVPELVDTRSVVPRGGENGILKT